MTKEKALEVFWAIVAFLAFAVPVVGAIYFSINTENDRFNNLTPHQKALERWGCEANFHDYPRTPRAVYECNKLFKQEPRQ